MSPAAKTFSDLPADVVEQLERELSSLGVTGDDGTVTPDWQRAIRQAIEAPLKATVVTRRESVSTRCDVSLSHGEGLARQTSRSVHAEADGTVGVDEVHATMVVTRFAQDDLWAVIASSMPNLPELRSTGLPPVLESERIPTTLPELTALERDARATVLYSLAAGERVAMNDPSIQAPTYESEHLWLLEDRILEIKTVPERDDPPGDTERRVVLVPEGPGSIARQIVWDVLGAQQFLSGATQNGAR